ncbi:MAG: hypothetical protein NW216_03795 [Hyphomicrobium sp.]|nr:hypothetical protein [Hyphomicrobium sp.]
MMVSRTHSKILILTATAGVAVLSWSGAMAADFGGDCCADLEERIAELEATTVRKGNRKLTLDISGQVNQALLFWDDGEISDVNQVTNGNSRDRFRFDGAAKISQDLRAGYFLEFGVKLASTSTIDQREVGGEPDPQVRQSLWYLDSRSLGAVSLGLASPASDDIMDYNLGGTSVAASSNVSQVGGSMFLRDSSLNGPTALNSRSSGNTIPLRWRRFADRLDTPSSNLVRYDTPIIMGFSASAAWGGDDFWDVAGRYAYENDDVRLAFGVGYFENLNEDESTFGWPRGGDNEPNGGNTVIREVKGSVSLLHKPSGIFVSGAYFHREFSGSDLGVLTFACFNSGDAADIRALGIACGNRPDTDYYWVNAGLRRKWLPIGATSIYGEYGHSSDSISGLNVSVRSAGGGDIDYVTSSSMDVYGAGIVQQVNASAMELYASWRHFSADVSGLESNGNRIDAPLEDADMFLLGSRIRF